MMTDAIDHGRQTSGIANEGVFSGVFSALEKLAFAIGPLIAGIVLSGFGFVESHGGPVEQAENAILGIVLLYSAIPAALQILALAVFSRYRL